MRIFFLITLYFFTCVLKAHDCCTISFHDGMSNFEWYRPLWVQLDTDWNLAYQLYTQYVCTNREYQTEPRIPKIIHQIWIGSPLPEKYLPLIDSWKKHHPDWTYILWDDAMIEALNLENKEQYALSNNWGQKADIARYEILYRFGGMYVDIDFECLKPFDQFHHCYDYYTGVGYSGRFAVFNGLIGSVPGHPILRACIDTLDITTYYEGTSDHNILFTTGPFHQARCFVAHALEGGRVVAFPVNYFYPWPFSKKDDARPVEEWYHPETYAIHYWHASWRESANPMPTKAFFMDDLIDGSDSYQKCFGSCFPYFYQSLLNTINVVWQSIVSCSLLLKGHGS